MIRFQLTLKNSIRFGIVGLVIASVGIVSAQVKPDRAIKYRQSVMTMVGWNAGPMGAMMKGKMKFDTAVFAKNAGRISMLLPMATEGFVKGSDMGKTRAKPEIWSDMAGFKQELQKAVDAANKLASVAKGGDEAATKEQFKALGQACGSCHKKFRKKKS